MGSVNDPIADLLTKIRNASKAQHRYFDISWSRMKESIVKILKEQGFIAHYLIKEEKRKGTLRVFLKYDDERRPIISYLKRISKPSLRRYVSALEIPRIKGKMGIAIISTSKGVLDGESARLKKVGGEFLCVAW